MKLQNLTIIFIIIIIPIVSIFALYLNLETKTIVLQTDYDEKLIEATKEAMSAFEINTTEWTTEYALLANTKRQDLLSSINVFTTSLADKLRIGGASKESVLTYVPAVVFTMYDGYYIYAPTYVPQTITDDNGVQLFYYDTNGYDGTQITSSATQNINGTIVSGTPIYFAKTGEGTLGTYNGEQIYYTTDVNDAEKTYKHILKTFVPYTGIYGDYTINYTLDDYIRIYGGAQSKEGYLVEGAETITNLNNIIKIPVNDALGIKVNGKEIKVEQLTENIYVKETASEEASLKEYPYIYNSTNDKRYYDATEDKFFMVNNSNVKVYLPEVELGEASAEYKKVLVRPNDTNGDYLELYQLLNGSDESNKDWYYKYNENQYIKYEAYQPLIDRSNDCSAINYYVETYSFNYWLIKNNIDIDQILETKTEAIIANINNNLNLSISNYSANSKIDYQIPELSYSDWEQALSNISMITFFQGVKVGLKTYNNYAIVTSTENKEFVSEDSLYYLGGDSDIYYHRYYCSKGTPKTYEAYRNTDYKVQSYESDDTIKYYYKHYNSANLETQECFDCIVNRNNYLEETNTGNQGYYDKTFCIALGRERYIQMQRTRLTKSSAIEIELEEMQVAHTTSTEGNNKTVNLNISGGSGNYTINWKYKTSIFGNYLEHNSALNQTTYTSNKNYDIQYIVTDNITGEIVSKIVNTQALRLDIVQRVSTGIGLERVTFVMAGGTSPYRYYIRYEDGTQGSTNYASGSFSVEIVSGKTYTIVLLDNAGNVAQMDVTGGE